MSDKSEKEGSTGGEETLPNGVTYVTAVADSPGFYGNTSTYAVPPGHYFVIGDNTGNSDDSRALG